MNSLQEMLAALAGTPRMRISKHGKGREKADMVYLKAYRAKRRAKKQQALKSRKINRRRRR